MAVLLWLILLASISIAVCATVLILRRAAPAEHIGMEVRDDLRASREEARTASKELRQEVADGLKLTSDTLSRTLESSTKAQGTQLEMMGRQLKELSESNQTALDGIRGTLDSPCQRATGWQREKASRGPGGVIRRFEVKPRFDGQQPGNSKHCASDTTSGGDQAAERAEGL